MKRVMVVGAPGSGKSTLAVALGKLTGLPVYHMDMIHWMPGWTERPRAEKIAMVQDVETRDEWILEGGLSVTYDNRAANADTLVWIDLPLALRLVRILKRRWIFRGGRTRPDLPENCPEKLDWEFLHYFLTTSGKTRQKIGATIGRAPNLRVHHLRSRSAISNFLAGFGD